MHLSASEIEIVVSRVSQRLRDLVAHTPAPHVTSSAPFTPADQGPKVASDFLSQRTLSQPLITLDSISGKLDSITQLHIPRRAIVTPAARDWLNQRNIVIVREPSDSFNNDVARSEKRSGSIIVSGTVSWLGTLKNGLCPKQSHVAECARDETAALREISSQLRQSDLVGVLIVNAPHAACWQAAREEHVRPAVISQWSDVDDVLREVPTNLIVLGSKRWSMAATANLVRKLIQHMNVT